MTAALETVELAVAAAEAASDKLAHDVVERHVGVALEPVLVVPRGASVPPQHDAAPAQPAPGPDAPSRVTTAGSGTSGQSFHSRSRA